MVDQGGEGGAYESGGYNPDMVYNNDVANQAVESFGKVVGAALGSRTAEDQNKSDIKTKERLDKKEARLSDKKDKLMGNAEAGNKRDRLTRRIDKTEKKEAKVEARINDYNKTKNPSLKATLTTTVGNPSANQPAAASNKKETGSQGLFNISDQSKTDYSNNSNLKAPKTQKEDWKNKLNFFGK